LIVLLLIVQFAIAWTMPEIHRGVQPEGLIGLSPIIRHGHIDYCSGAASLAAWQIPCRSSATMYRDGSIALPKRHTCSFTCSHSFYPYWVGPMPLIADGQSISSGS
jgi:hypothetical protein